MAKPKTPIELIEALIPVLEKHVVVVGRDAVEQAYQLERLLKGWVRVDNK